jgi:hypothetical protein
VISSLLFALRMDIKEIRRANLDVLKAEARSFQAIEKAMLDRFPGDPQKGPPRYANTLSQVRNGKPMGDKLARKIEEAMGKDRGWMDTLHRVDETMEGKEAAQLAMGMDPEKRENWLKLGRALVDQDAKPGVNTPFPRVPKGGKRLGGSGSS